MRSQSWEQPFSCAVWLPQADSTVNGFLTSAWRNDRLSEFRALGVQLTPRKQGVDGWVASTDPDALPDTMLAVLPSFAELLLSTWRASGSPEFETWAREFVLSQSPEDAAPQGAIASWRYDQVLEQLSPAEMVTRELFVWPQDSSELTVSELLGVPHLPELPDQPDFDSLAPEVVDLGRNLWSQVSGAEAVYRLTMTHRGLDIVAILGRATDPRYAALVTPETGVALRKFSRQLRDRVAASGWRLSGYADALSWPLHIESGEQFPANLVSELAVDLLRRAETVGLPPAPDLAEWERRLVVVESLRERRNQR